MFSIFHQSPTSPTGRHPDFSYINEGTQYFDSACQTMRPQPVITAETEYYYSFNACGHRVKYPWGERVDQIVQQTRQDIVAYIGANYNQYETAFTLNTTYGINLVLNQIPLTGFTKIVTSQTEHNSVLLPTIQLARRAKLEHLVLKRSEDGSLQFSESDLAKAIIILNTTSNIDGRSLSNAKEVISAAHKQGSLVLFDAAQTLGHAPSQLRGLDFDALFSSGHKMYGPSLGIIVIKRNLLAQLSAGFIGGGMVTDAYEHDFTLITDERELFSRLEPGLQNWAGIVGLQAAVSWLKTFRLEKQNAEQYEQTLAGYLRAGLESINGLHLISPAQASVQSVYSDKLDAHQLALALGQNKMMARSGYFCCHYYLQHVKNLPPLLRLALGLHNTKSDIDGLIKALSTVLARL